MSDTEDQPTGVPEPDAIEIRKQHEAAKRNIVLQDVAIVQSQATIYLFNNFAKTGDELAMMMSVLFYDLCSPSPGGEDPEGMIQMLEQVIKVLREEAAIKRQQAEESVESLLSEDA